MGRASNLLVGAPAGEHATTTGVVSLESRDDDVPRGDLCKLVRYAQPRWVGTQRPRIPG